MSLTGFRLTKSGNKREPIAWLAYEVLRGKRKEYASDVWSFAVYLWEVWQLGFGHPYGHLRKRGAIGNKSLILCNLKMYIFTFPLFPIDVPELLQFLWNGHRLAMPELCPDQVFQIMMQCWNLDHFKRPSFEELKVQLEKVAERIQQNEVRVRIHRESSKYLPLRNQEPSENCHYTPVVSPATFETDVPYDEFDGISQLFRFPSVPLLVEEDYIIPNQGGNHYKTPNIGK